LEAELSGLRERCGVRHRAAQADTTRSGEWAFGGDPHAAHHADRAARKTRLARPVNPGDPRL